MTSKPAVPRRLTMPRRALLAAAVLVVLAAGTGAGVAALHRAPTGRIELIATRADGGPAALAGIELSGPDGSARLDTPARAVAPAPQPTDLGGFDVPAGLYRQVTARLDGRTLSAPLTMRVTGDRLTPVLVALGRGGLTAYAGNDGVNLGLLVSGGQVRPVPPTTFTDQAGRPVTLGGLPTVVAAFATHCHETCPLFTAVLGDLQRTLRARGWEGRVRITEVTMDPGRDTPATLAEYARRTGAGWPLLTAPAAPLRVFWSALHASYHEVPYPGPPPSDWLTGRPETYDVSHDSLAAVLDAQGVPRFILPGEPHLGHALPEALARMLSPEAEGHAHTGSWAVTDLLDRVDVLLGEPGEQDRRPESAVRVGAAAPGFILTALDGRRVVLAEQVGRPVVLNFWASWCGPCRRELPLLARAAASHPDLVVLALDQGEDAATVRAFAADVPGVTAVAVLDPERRAGAGYAVGGLPVSVAIDAGGTVRAVHVGEIDAAALDRLLAQIGA
ncbi:MAG TPA: redoxin domain-containing protein [Candidatus Dormibacteraeota bacterium]|jgi:cytochrome oxidase Cu insertion factor (SCO1/SenC/PrrC family)/thiol-disulfide isomerase/thioredoxin